MKNPKISIIVPIYGVEKYLRECLNSIIAQTLKDIEIILIDDGSKDTCPQIIDEYALKDKRIKVIHKQNGGYGQTCNVGLSQATGEYIAIVEPDDYIATEMYADLYTIAEKYNSDIVKSAFYNNFQAKEKTKLTKVKWEDFIPEDKSFRIKEYPYFLYYHPSVWSCIYKREFLTKHNIKFVEAPGSGWTDNPFQVQTMCLANKINYTSEAYYYWRILDKYESDALKDYTIPFKRSEEIHQWLKQNKIKDKNILLHLARRELWYINIVLGMKDIEDNKDCKKKIKKLMSYIPEKLFLESKQVRDDEKELYLLIKKDIDLAREKILKKRNKKKLFSLRLNKREKSITLFGKKWSFN